MKMVIAQLALVLLVFSALAPAAQADVLVSELCDPRVNYLTDRYIEIYNSGATAEDLTGWQIVAMGNSVEIFTWNLSGTIAPGQALVAGDQTTVDVFPVDFPAEAWSTSNSTWNGKIGDGARLKNDLGTVVDDIVVPGVAFENMTMVRNGDVTSPSPAYNAAEWTATPVDYPSEATPGTHSAVAGDGPVIGSITTVPASPVESETVDVQAAVTDAVANITAVTLNWGTISGALINPITMTNTGGDTFQTATPIPGQVAGTVIYFSVTAANDIPAETVSGEDSYTIPGANIPPGYYTSAEGLIGEPLRAALHNIIDNHTVISYDGLWSAFYTTDDKPNGKVWDMYSDVPGGTPPYEYTFGVDQGGTAGTEGTGYNREHSWPSSWYGATSPMYSDVFMVVPTDNEVNNKRGSFPFGEVNSPTWTSLNGSRLGPCAYPGYSGTVFEPIDEYKGDFARAYFYMTTRYFGEDAGWPGSDMTSGATLLPWAEALLLEWNADDPVSAKEVDRNEAVYDIQGNRNPFIDRPEFVGKVFQPELSPVPGTGVLAGVVLHQNVPNPFNPSTTIKYELESAGQVDLQVFDLAGRLVRTLYSGSEAAGQHEKVWMGRDQAGRTVATGVYFYRLHAGDEVETRRMLLAK
ncbi:MAG: endonuclease [Candidatus Krumholzibacteriota bacterium]